MKRSHELIVGVIEVSNLALEVLYQLQRWELHEEVLNAPFSVLFADLILAICHLSVDIAAQLQQKVYHTHELVLVLQKLIITPFL